ncbi:MAG: DUF58 domain-containing protein [Conchiformibius sp.]|nr:DUF58 domain-containing protein [Conchiformibius sp.]
MWRSEPDPAVHGAALLPRHIRLRPTRLCVSLWVLSAAVWVGAVNYQVNVAYAVCFWLLAFTGVAALMTARQLLGLKLNLLFEGEVFAGQTAEIRLDGGGSGKRPRLFWWQGVAGGRTDGAWQRAEQQGGQPFQAVWPLAVKRRGHFPAPMLLNVATTAPFGLFYAECRIEWQTDAVAYPTPLPHQDYGSHPNPDPEATPQQTAANGDDLAYLKAHQTGASLQHVAWKVYAKRGELMDKVFDEPPLTTRSEMISYRDYPSGTPADRLASLLAHRVLQAERGGLPYTLELPQLRIAPQNGQREKSLNALALM